ncbi:uncharacterized protein hhla1 isoform X2 [Takifugu rubripes]|uniref:uncharacterized protein hhla1 isoform X2 n=1 Tax=Takifugu rubripes TaxID=31033 RepID=UPI0011458ECE|nr:HERV-H LTR-associating protein 1 isoform X2 [Takifugu rubripes]
MGDSHRAKHQLFTSTAFILLLLLLTHTGSGDRKEETSAESLAEPIDLTPLVNTLMNSSQSGSQQLFSLLTVTSYSALHKLTLLVYNISSVRSFSSSWFRRRFCYCVTNHTNDLTGEAADFSAILLDVMRNSTSYVHELFKSASIVSVGQRNQSTCTYICLMAGRTGQCRRSLTCTRSAAQHQASPQLFTAGTESTPLPPQPRPGAPATRPAGPAAPPSTSASAQLATQHSFTWPATTETTLPSMPLQTPGCPSDRPGGPAAVVAMTTAGAQGLQRCVLQLCSFFSRCVCGRLRRHTRPNRFCVHGQNWYHKHVSEVCRRARRTSPSRNVKQRCVIRMCEEA